MLLRAISVTTFPNLRGDMVDMNGTSDTTLDDPSRPHLVFGEKEWFALCARVVQYWSILHKKISILAVISHSPTFSCPLEYQDLVPG